MMRSDHRSTRGWRVGSKHRRERATQRHRAKATYRTATAARRGHAAEPAARRQSERFVLPGPWPRDPIRPARQLAHRLGVRAVRGERAIPESVVEQSERSSRRLRTTNTRRVQRLPRHVANRIPTRRRAARGAKQASRRPVRTRSCNPRGVRFRFLAPQSLCRPVPSVVRRITERNSRPRKGAGRIGIAAAGCVFDARHGSVLFPIPGTTREIEEYDDG